MSIISSITGTLVRVFGESGKAACSIAGAVATVATAANDGAAAIGKLAAAAKDSATEYHDRVVKDNHPADPEVRANRELSRELCSIARKDYRHLTFLNEENAAQVLRVAIRVLQHVAKEQGKEPQPVEWFVLFLSKSSCRADINELIADSYCEYMNVLAKTNASAKAKGSKPDTSGSSADRSQAEEEMDELLAQRQAYQSQSYGDYYGFDYQPQPKAKAAATPKAFSKRSNRADAATSSEGVAQSAAKMGAEIQEANTMGAAEDEETGSAGSESSKKKNQQ